MKVKVTITTEDGEVLDQIEVEDAVTAGVSSFASTRKRPPETIGVLSNMVRAAIENDADLNVDDE